MQETTKEAGMYNIDELIKCDAYMQCCVDIIEAYHHGDNMVLQSVSGCIARKEWPFPSCISAVTKPFPLGEGVCGLKNVGAKRFIILLAAIILDAHLPNQEFHSEDDA